jgi:long-chain-fatty-acid--CoA ligase ACSBG
MSLSTSEPDVCVKLRMSNEGFAATPAITVVDKFKETVAKFPNHPALRQKKKVDGVLPADWKTWTWTEYYADSIRFAKSLIHLNVDMFKISNIIGFNSPEWLIANNGSIAAGCIAAGIYTSNIAESCLYITAHSKAEVLVLEDNKQLMKYAGKGAETPNLKAIVVYGEAINTEAASQFNVPLYTFEDFMELGKDVSDADVEARQKKVQAGNCCTLIYTSGTTGPPKAVMISNDNITWTAKNLIDNFLFEMNLGTERIVSYLPLSHIAGQMVDIHAPMFIGGCTYFAQPDALKGSLTTTLKDVKPTLFFGVPRVWEKIQEKMVSMGRETTGLKKVLSTWAKGCGAERTRRAQFGQDGGVSFGYGCAHSLVLSKIKTALGLDQCKYHYTAAAPIAQETLEYFGSLDIQIMEVFGQSECTGPHTASRPGAWKIGSCGRPMPGTETMVAQGTDELCYRGRHIFMGYMYMDDKTAETIDSDGWLHSGDVATFDENNTPGIPAPSGFMHITGRIKDLIITAGGENIPPTLIENEMKQAMLAISNCLVIGDRRKYLTMLISMKTEVDSDGIPTDKLTGDALFEGNRIGATATTMSEAATDPKWVSYFNEGMKLANKNTTSNAQVVQKWTMLPVDLSEKAGDLTPTLKVKRNVVNEKYAELAESMYA